MTEPTVLFRTEHGSRLYNLHNENSDYDWYTVVSGNPTNRKRYARQRITGETDSFVIDLGTWLHQVANGVPQACEALMSRRAVVDELTALRSNYLLTPNVAERYLRTIKSFAMSDTEKSRRHAARLALNLRDILRYGRFNPSLSAADIEFCNWWGNESDSTKNPETLANFLRNFALTGR